MKGLARRYWMLTLAIGLAAAGVVWVMTPGTPEPGVDVTERVRETAPVYEPAELPPARLEGRPAPAPPFPPAPAPPVPPALPTEPQPVVEVVVPSHSTDDHPADDDEDQREGAPGDPEPAPRFPARPRIVDPALGDPALRPRIERGYVLSTPSLDRALPYLGVVELDHDDAGATIEPEIEAPLVTAIQGTVVSAEGPVAEAEVVVYSTFYQRHARYDRHVREVGRTLTNGFGVFDLRPIGLDTVHFGADGEILLTIRREGFGAIVATRQRNIEPEVSNDLGTFTLDARLPLLTGTILDLEGRPVEGAAVRVSGSVDPVRYDKTERMVILKDCPSAYTDEEGRYVLSGFAAGVQHVSIHVNIDCVLHQSLAFQPGAERNWSPRVLAGGSVKGIVVDPDGRPIGAAVVSGGGNWTPTNPDGTFWLDNIHDGPFQLHVAHHQWKSVYVADVEAGQEDLEIAFETPLPRVTILVQDAETLDPVPLVTIDWVWRHGGPPHVFVPESRHWHAADGRYEVIVPETAMEARVAAEGYAPFTLAEGDLSDGRIATAVLARPTDAD